MNHIALIPLLAFQPMLAISAQADTPAHWSFSEQTVMMMHEDPAIRMQAGLAACIGTTDGPETAADTVAVFQSYGWTGGTWGELTELGYLTTTAFIADDNGFCEVNDFAVTTIAAKEVVNTLFQEAGIAEWAEVATGAGCITFQGPQGRLIEINSGGGDPMCGDFQQSAIRVWNPEIKQ